MTVKQYLPRTWVSPKLISKKSRIHGDGVFTKERITEGEKLMEFGGELISKEHVLSRNYRSRSVWIVYPGYYLALPNSDTQESLDEYLNHSCNANAWLADEVTLVARRDMGVGEEVTLDQGTWNFEYIDYTDDKASCSCGAKDCRKILTENDWKLPDVQEKYNGHFHPMIQAMIDELK
ncbi:MAG: SET domain-containing protein-lysine N-methyltransferase [Candidatus Sungbacteria bacterium]|nr:SET domain-containing protein-lysine N-methyltransferase [bacterium]MDZ4260326.1 SET domain-containing protein-lysine N-methyltransferase [Candidatus Sungbacteria bacterium]